ncbi:MAG TPA: ABC transporter ATP-binding protein [Gemmatimonadaceae bacterium]|jgi:Cu-processing system ATP-binding protein|nr:ABC transporter ATP-binding protein [Gemmatimonadaceae bacterium]
MIEVSKVTKRFGDNQVLRGVDLTVAGGRVMGLVGPNGAGKTTLIKTLLGLCQPTSGEIRIDGETILGTEGSYRARIGYMPQIARFPENLTGAELFDMLRDLRGEPGLLDAELLRGFALEVGGQLDKPLRVLSGGTRQKVNACLALLFRPSILVLDEPTAGLDPLSSAILKDRILSLRSEGVTVLVTSHIMSELEELCDDVAFLLDGVTRFVGPVAQLTAMTQKANLERAIAALMIREVA